MQIFTNEFKEAAKTSLAKLLAYLVVFGIPALLVRLVGAIETGRLWP